jgi:hypothetical protein
MIETLAISTKHRTRTSFRTILIAEAAHMEAGTVAASARAFHMSLDVTDLARSIGVR